MPVRRSGALADESWLSTSPDGPWPVVVPPGHWRGAGRRAADHLLVVRALLPAPGMDAADLTTLAGPHRPSLVVAAWRRIRRATWRHFGRYLFMSPPAARRAQ